LCSACISSVSPRVDGASCATLLAVIGPGDPVLRSLENERPLFEGKGPRTERDDSKTQAAKRWRDGVDDWGAMGRWEYAIAWSEADVPTILAELSIDGRAR
jgi:hypothetical protein